MWFCGFWGNFAKLYTFFAKKLFYHWMFTKFFTVYSVSQQKSFLNSFPSRHCFYSSLRKWSFPYREWRSRLGVGGGRGHFITSSPIYRPISTLYSCRHGWMFSFSLKDDDRIWLNSLSSSLISPAVRERRRKHNGSGRENVSVFLVEYEEEGYKGRSSLFWKNHLKFAAIIV